MPSLPVALLAWALGAVVAWAVVAAVQRARLAVFTASAWYEAWTRHRERCRVCEGPSAAWPRGYDCRGRSADDRVTPCPSGLGPWTRLWMSWAWPVVLPWLAAQAALAAPADWLAWRLVEREVAREDARRRRIADAAEREAEIARILRETLP